MTPWKNVEIPTSQNMTFLKRVKAWHKFGGKCGQMGVKQAKIHEKGVYMRHLVGIA